MLKATDTPCTAASQALRTAHYITAAGNSLSKVEVAIQTDHITVLKEDRAHWMPDVSCFVNASRYVLSSCRPCGGACGTRCFASCSSSAA